VESAPTIRTVGLNETVLEHHTSNNFMVCYLFVGVGIVLLATVSLVALVVLCKKLLNKRRGSVITIGEPYAVK